MSYMRGNYYVWASGDSDKDSRVHVWVEAMESNLKESGWAHVRERVSGTSLPEPIFDELVVMRYAELEEEGEVDAAARRALRHYGGNVGCMALCKKYGKPTAVDRLLSRPKRKRKVAA
jgi:hypothetical protein